MNQSKNRLQRHLREMTPHERYGDYTHRDGTSVSECCRLVKEEKLGQADYRVHTVCIYPKKIRCSLVTPVEV
jgi:hypothetical protein